MEVIFKVAVILLFSVCAAMVIGVVLIDLREMWKRRRNIRVQKELLAQLREDEEALRRMTGETPGLRTSDGKANLAIARGVVDVDKTFADEILERADKAKNKDIDGESIEVCIDGAKLILSSIQIEVFLKKATKLEKENAELKSILRLMTCFQGRTHTELNGTK